MIELLYCKLLIPDLNAHWFVKAPHLDQGWVAPRVHGELMLASTAWLMRGSALVIARGCILLSELVSQRTAPLSTAPCASMVLHGC
jgi:hypothetical protein